MRRKTNLSEAEKISLKARRKVLAKKAFFIHFIVFGGIALILNVLSLAISDVRFWLLFPILPLGIAVFLHYSIVFGIPYAKYFDKDWENDQMYSEERKLISESTNKQDHLDLEIIRHKSKSYRDSDFV